jgi:hypothetical protein
MKVQDFKIWIQGFYSGVSGDGLTAEEWTYLRQEIAKLEVPESVFAPPPYLPYLDPVRPWHRPYWTWSGGAGDTVPPSGTTSSDSTKT